MGRRGISSTGAPEKYVDIFCVSIVADITTTFQSFLVFIKPFQNAEEDVCVKRALVHLVQHHNAVLLQPWVCHRLFEQHAIGQELEHRTLGSLVCESDRVADFIAQLHTHLLRYSMRHAHGRKASGLGARNRPGKPRLAEDLG